MGNKQGKRARKLKKVKETAVAEPSAAISESRVPSPPVNALPPPAAPVEVKKKTTTKCKLYFSDKETEKIRQYLHELSSSEKADHMSRDDFLVRLGFNNASRFVTRFFDIYDPEGTGYVRTHSRSHQSVVTNAPFFL